jgi:hypothetical protein
MKLYAFAKSHCLNFSLGLNKSHESNELNILPNFTNLKNLTNTSNTFITLVNFGKCSNEEKFSRIIMNISTHSQR